MKISVRTDIGLRKKVNQDYYYISDDKKLLIIADGMGGHKAGEVASQLAVSVISKALSKLEDLPCEKDILKSIEDSIIEANNIIFKKSNEDIRYKGMGTTLSLAYIDKGLMYIGHVGDSRIYKISNNKLSQLTEDHSLVKELLKKGTITREEAENHPQKNIITRAVGTGESIEVDLVLEPLSQSDIILLTTDGLTNEVSDEEIERVFLEKSLDEACLTLVELAKELGSYDNITIIAAKLKN